MKIIGDYDRKYLLIGISLDVLIAVLYFFIPLLYKFITLLVGLLSWIAIVFLFFKNYRLRARSFLVGLGGPFALIFIILIIIFLVLVVTKD